MCILARKEQEIVLNSFKKDYSTALTIYRNTRNKYKFTKTISKIFKEIKSILSLDYFEDDVFDILKKIYDSIAKKIQPSENY